MTEWKPDICIYHGNCDDGFGAAWAIWTAWPDCEFVAGFYGTDLPNVDGKNVLFVDFSAKRPVIDALAQTAKTIVIIDHHKTAEEDLAPFAVTMCGSAVLNPHDIQHMFRDLAELDRPPIIAWFDVEQSGAAMAWQFAQGGHRDEFPIPTMLEWIEDRDLWRFVNGDATRNFSAALRTYPMDFKVWDEIAEKPSKLLNDGKAILRAHRANIQKLMREAYTETVGGFAVPVVNAPYHYASDTAHELLAAYPDAPFAACWFRRADGQIQWSLRSESHRQDVSEIAARFGGGGHRNAAGFQSPAPSPQPNLAAKPAAWRYRPPHSSMWQFTDSYEPTIVGWICEPLYAAPAPLPNVTGQFDGTIDSDSPLQAAAREAGWALTTLVDFSDWQKRDQISAIIARLAAALLDADCSAPPQHVAPEIDGGRFEEWSLADFAAQCRMQSREQLDPEFSRFMAALAKRLSELPPAPEKHVAGYPTGLKPIPIEAAKRIAKDYGYDQVLIYARRCHDTPQPHGEHMTTYGRTREHCDVAARIGDTLKKFMGWEV